MLDFLELEETVGRAWHRLVGGTASYPVHAEHAVSLADVRNRIAIMFRAFGGESGVQIASASARQTGHRLGWRQRIGLGDERVDQPGRDAATIFLPDSIAIFPDRELNAALYRWLAAWFAFAPAEAIEESDPLRRDLSMLRRASEIAVLVLTQCPGLADDYAGCRRRPPWRGRTARCRASSKMWSRSCSLCSVPIRRPRASCGRP